MPSNDKSKQSSRLLHKLTKSPFSSKTPKKRLEAAQTKKGATPISQPERPSFSSPTSFNGAIAGNNWKLLLTTRDNIQQEIKQLNQTSTVEKIIQLRISIDAFMAAVKQFYQKSIAPHLKDLQSTDEDQKMTLLRNNLKRYLAEPNRISEGRQDEGLADLHMQLRGFMVSFNSLALFYPDKVKPFPTLNEENQHYFWTLDANNPTPIQIMHQNSCFALRQFDGKNWHTILPEDYINWQHTSLSYLPNGDLHFELIIVDHVSQPFVARKISHLGIFQVYSQSDTWQIPSNTQQQAIEDAQGFHIMNRMRSLPALISSTVKELVPQKSQHESQHVVNKTSLFRSQPAVQTTPSNPSLRNPSLPPQNPKKQTGNQPKSVPIPAHRFHSKQAPSSFIPQNKQHAPVLENPNISIPPEKPKSTKNLASLPPEKVPNTKAREIRSNHSLDFLHDGIDKTPHFFNDAIPEIPGQNPCDALDDPQPEIPEKNIPANPVLDVKPQPILKKPLNPDSPEGYAHRQSQPVKDNKHNNQQVVDYYSSKTSVVMFKDELDKNHDKTAQYNLKRAAIDLAITFKNQWDGEGKINLKTELDLSILAPNEAALIKKMLSYTKETLIKLGVEEEKINLPPELQNKPKNGEDNIIYVLKKRKEYYKNQNFQMIRLA